MSEQGTEMRGPEMPVTVRMLHREDALIAVPDVKDPVRVPAADITAGTGLSLEELPGARLVARVTGPEEALMLSGWRRPGELSRARPEEPARPGGEAPQAPAGDGPVTVEVMAVQRTDAWLRVAGEDKPARVPAGPIAEALAIPAGHLPGARLTAVARWEGGERTFGEWQRAETPGTE